MSMISRLALLLPLSIVFGGFVIPPKNVVLESPNAPEPQPFEGPSFSPRVDRETRSASCKDYGYNAIIHHRRKTNRTTESFSTVVKLDITFKKKIVDLADELTEFGDEERVVDVRASCSQSDDLSFSFVIWKKSDESGGDLYFRTIIIDRGVAVGLIEESFGSIEEAFTY